MSLVEGGAGGAAADEEAFSLFCLSFFAFAPLLCSLLRAWESGEEAHEDGEDEEDEEDEDEDPGEEEELVWDAASFLPCSPSGSSLLANGLFSTTGVSSSNTKSMLVECGVDCGDEDGWILDLVLLLLLLRFPPLLWQCQSAELRSQVFSGSESGRPRARRKETSLRSSQGKLFFEENLSHAGGCLLYVENNFLFQSLQYVEIKCLVYVESSESLQHVEKRKITFFFTTWNFSNLSSMWNLNLIKMKLLPSICCLPW